MWNTYHARGVNNVVHIPDLAAVRIGLYDKKQKLLMENLLWNHWDQKEPNNIKRFGPHAEDGSYFELESKYLSFSYRMEFASDGEAFVMEIRADHSDPNMLFYISPLLLWGREGSVGVKGNVLSITTPGSSFTVNIKGTLDKAVKIYTETAGAAIKADSKVTLFCNIQEAAAEKLLIEKRDACLKTTRLTEGWLNGVSDAINAVLAWNTIYDEVNSRICVPVSRAWCTGNGRGFGSYVIFGWDTYFDSVMGALFSKNLADMQFASICDEATPAGMVPNFGSQRGGSPDRAEPPVGAYCLLKLYRQFEDKSMLTKYYEVLKKWNRWWYPRRDANGDGLIELGSDPNINGIENGFFDEGNCKQTGIFESGMDNSPMYDDVVFNTETHTLELNDIGQNSLYALDCYCMGIIAGELGKTEDSEIFMREYNRVKDLVRELMWDEEESMYCNTRWDGKKDHVYSPNNFYPIIAGIATAEQAKAMIQKHLLNDSEFGGKYVIPTIGRNQRGFTDQNYWRGRVWGPTNYLVYEGLRRLGDRESAAIIAEKGLALFREEWEAEGHIHENYNSITGDGDDVRNADPYYTWGALLAYIPVTEFIYMDIDSGVHFGGTKLPGSLIKDFPLADARYTLDTREGFCLLRNGRPFIKSDSPMELGSYCVENGKASFTVNGKGCIILEKQDDLAEFVILKDRAPVYSGRLPAKVDV